MEDLILTKGKSEVLFDRLPLAGLVIDQNGIIQQWNAAAQTLFGWTANEAIGSHRQILVPIQHHGEVESMGQAMPVGDHEGACITENATKDGRTIACEWWSTVLYKDAGEVIACLSLVQEIAGCKQREESLSWLASIAECSDDAIIAATLDGIIFSWNPAAEKIFGYSAEEVKGCPLSRLVPPDRADEVSQIIGRISRGERVDHYETVHVRKDGRQIALCLTVSPIIGAHREITGASAIARDVTERRRVEQALRASETRLRHLVEAEVFGVVVGNCQGQITEANNAYLRLVGHTREDLLAGRVRWDRLTPPEYRHRDLQAIEEIRTSGVCTPFEKEYLRQDGSRVPILIGAAGLDNPQKDMVGFVLDLTDRKRIEEALRASEKLAATGRMAAKVAHEINNPLAGIKSAFALVKDAVRKDHPYYDYVGRIDKEINRIAGIVRQMYDLYRPEPETARKFRLEEAIRDVVALLEPSSRQHDVAIMVELPESPVVVSGPEASLRQVLSNLVENAIEASRPGGVVRIGATVTRDWLRISVIDQGSGIPEAAAARVFEPFFTTKAAEHPGGLGLGLSISKSLVGALGGSLDFRSELGRGTTFRLNLPLPTG